VILTHFCKYLQKCVSCLITPILYHIQREKSSYLLILILLFSRVMSENIRFIKGYSHLKTTTPPKT